MERLSCPAHDQDQLASMTLKARSTELAEADFNGVLGDYSADPADLSLQELKLETDSMMALIAFLITRGLGGNDSYQQFLADHISAERDNSLDESEHPLQILKEKGSGMLWRITYSGLTELRATDESGALFDRLERYRSAYYSRSPQTHEGGRESFYGNVERLLHTGVLTSTTHFAHLLYALDAAVIVSPAELSKDEKVKLARESDHLPALLAKLAVKDLARYTNFLNQHDEVSLALVKLQPHQDGYRAVFDHRVLEAAQAADTTEKPEYAHRLRKGCPASVSFEGLPSSITELWRLTVGALEKAGHWD